MKKENGQTVIETALMIMLLFILFFGIAEVARAFWLKNQLNNAARIGVRVAVVSDSATMSGITGTTCTSANAIVSAACNSITSGELRTAARTTLTGGAAAGDTVTVTVSSNFATIVPGLSSLSFGLIPNNIPLTGSSVMRHE